MSQNLAPNARTIVRNLTMLQDGTVLAGYRIGATRWDFSGRDAKAQFIHGSAETWSHLTGRYLEEAIETRPAPVQAWAHNLDRRTPHPLPDVHTCDGTASRGDLLAGRCGCSTWNSLLAAQQRRIAGMGMDDKVVFRYFSLEPKLPAKFPLSRHLQTWLDGGELHEKLAPLVADEERVFNIVTEGWTGSRRMTEREQAWLRKRSLAPSMQPATITNSPGGWDDMSLPALEADVRWHIDPFDRVATVHSWDDNGVQRESAVRVLMLARVNDLEYPDNGAQPWQTHAERAVDASGRSFPVSWRVKGWLVPGDLLESTTELELRTALTLQQDYANAERPEPEAVTRAAEVALETRNQVVSGRPVTATRFRGVVMVAVAGGTRVDNGRVTATASQVVEERSAVLTRLYAAGPLRMDLAGADDQAGALRAFVPGEPITGLGFERRLRLDFLAAGGPSVTGHVGDGRGPLIGYTVGANTRAVHHDSFYATEGLSTGRGQNIHLVAGTLGSGKSVLKGLLIYLNARRGIPCIVSDPSGPLAMLCTLPELREHSQVIDLLKSPSGTLSPPGLVREPQPGDYDEPGQYAEARAEAQTERLGLVVDMARRCLDADLYDSPLVRAMLREAAQRHAANHSWETTSTLWDLVDALTEIGGDVATMLARELSAASTAPLLRLMWPARGQDAPVVGHYGKILTVITTPGISRAEDGIPRKDWNPREVGADAVLRLVALFTDRLAFSKTRSARLAVFYDEAESLTDSGAGRAMLSRQGRDHSKWNMAIYLGVKSVNPQMLSGELKNFIGSVFAGRMASIEPARSLLDLLNLEGDEYARVLMGLSQVQAGEFVHLDVSGRVGKIKVDVAYLPHLLAVLKTDPTPEGSDEWALDEEMMA